MVNPKNKWTFDPSVVGEVSNLASVECPINSKVYHSFPILYTRMPELVQEKCATPNKFGLPFTVNRHISKLIS